MKIEKRHGIKGIGVLGVLNSLDSKNYGNRLDRPKNNYLSKDDKNNLTKVKTYYFPTNVFFDQVKRKFRSRLSIPSFSLLPSPPCPLRSPHSLGSPTSTFPTLPRPLTKTHKNFILVLNPTLLHTFTGIYKFTEKVVQGRRKERTFGTPKQDCECSRCGFG